MLVFACSQSGDNDDGGNTPTPTPPDNKLDAYIQFKNLDLNSVNIYLNSERAGEPYAALDAMSSQTIQCASGEYSLYITYILNICGADIPYSNNAHTYFSARVDKDKTTLVSVPALINNVTQDELNAPLSSDVYIVIKNASKSDSLLFIKNGTTLKPENINTSDGLINAGEMGVYKTNAGAASQYSLQKNAQSALDLTVSTFDAGMVYSYEYNNSALTLKDTEALTMFSAYEERADSNESFSVPKPSNVGAAALNANEIRVSWNGTASYYFIYAAGSSAGEYKLTGVSLMNSWEHKGLEAGAAYYYKVKAFSANSNLCSYFSEEAYAQTPEL